MFHQDDHAVPAAVRPIYGVAGRADRSEIESGGLEGGFGIEAAVRRIARALGIGGIAVVIDLAFRKVMALMRIRKRYRGRRAEMRAVVVVGVAKGVPAGPIIGNRRPALRGDVRTQGGVRAGDRGGGR